jgi:hypothetical protein
MKNFFKTVLNVIENLLRKFVGEEIQHKEEPIVETEEVKTEEEPSNNDDEEFQPEVPPIVESPPVDINNPPGTNINGRGVQHCLWKPTSDTSPELVLAVAADDIRIEHLRLKLLDKNGNDIPLKRNKSYSTTRGNQLPGYKYGRFNFKPGFKFQDLRKHQPIQVMFYIETSKGEVHPCKVGDKDKFVVRDVSKRWVCTNGRIKEDPKVTTPHKH